MITFEDNDCILVVYNRRYNFGGNSDQAAAAVAAIAAEAIRFAVKESTKRMAAAVAAEAIRFAIEESMRCEAKVHEWTKDRQE